METTIIEAPIASERLTTSPSPELSRRLLVAPINREALDPNKPLVGITHEALGSFAGRDYTIFNIKSDEDRHAFWETQPEKTDAERMNKWLTDTQALFTNSHEFFTTTDRGKQWVTVFQQFGLSADTLQRDQLEKFYKTYLSSTDKAQGGEKKFLADIFASHRTPEGKLDREKIEKDLSALTWLANVFGEDSAHIISSLTAAETTLEETPDELITNTDTAMSSEETDMLESLQKVPETPMFQTQTTQPETPTNIPQTEPVASTPDETTTPGTQPVIPATSSQPITPAVQPTTTLPALPTSLTQPNAPTTHVASAANSAPPTASESKTATVTTVEIDPRKDLVLQVNESLTGKTHPVRFEATPEALTTYLRTLKPSQGTIKSIDAHIINGKLVIKGDIGVPMGSMEFSATLANTPTGGIIIESHTVNPHGLGGNIGKGKAEDYITHMDTKITELINGKVDQAWHVSSMHIADNKLGMEFSKK